MILARGSQAAKPKAIPRCSSGDWQQVRQSGRRASVRCWQLDPARTVVNFPVQKQRKEKLIISSFCLYWSKLNWGLHLCEHTLGTCEVLTQHWQGGSLGVEEESPRVKERCCASGHCSDLIKPGLLQPEPAPCGRGRWRRRVVYRRGSP